MHTHRARPQPTPVDTMLLSRIASKRNTLWALLALGVVIALCWGEQAGAVQQCPQNSTELQIELVAPMLDSQSIADPAGDCDQTEQLLTAQSYSADVALPTCLLLMWLLAGWLRRAPAPWRQSEPIGSPQRRHLVFCVFRE
jgi:hypothetical protein